MKKIKILICITSIVILCLTVVLGTVGCKSYNQMEASYWYGKYTIEPKQTSFHIEDIRESDWEPSNYYGGNFIAGIYENGYDYYTDIRDPTNLETIYLPLDEGDDRYFDKQIYEVLRNEFDKREKTVKINKKGLWAGKRFYELDEYRYTLTNIYRHKEAVYKDEGVSSRYVRFFTSDFDTIEKLYKALYYNVEWEIACEDGKTRKVVLSFLYKGEKV